MLNKILGFLAILIIAVIGAINLTMIFNKYNFSDMVLENAHALANDEEWRYTDCYIEIAQTNDIKDKVKSCKSPAYSCSTYVSGHAPTNSWTCN